MSMASLEQMKIELDAIGHSLADRRLSVPIYQRSYAWPISHVTNLLSDLSTASNEKEAEYFLGSIVAIKGPQGREEIVDGQQRLATTTILIAAIRDYFFENNDVDTAVDIERDYLITRDIRTQDRLPKLRLNDIDNDFFTKRILSQPGDTDRTIQPTKDSHELIAKYL